MLGAIGPELGAVGRVLDRVKSPPPRLGPFASRGGDYSSKAGAYRPLDVAACRVLDGVDDLWGGARRGPTLRGASPAGALVVDGNRGCAVSTMDTSKGSCGSKLESTRLAHEVGSMAWGGRVFRRGCSRWPGGQRASAALGCRPPRWGRYSALGVLFY